MGVFQLATFMKESLPNGTCEVSIKRECQQFQERTGERPTLVFDVLSIFAIFRNNKVWTLCGGRHQIFRKEFETFLENLSEFANLVFYEDGPSVKIKELTKTNRRRDRQDLEIEIIKQIDEGTPLKELTNVPRIKTSLGFLRKFGKHFIAVTKECDTEIARYASNDSSVLAVLSEDTDFLIFPGPWRYFSIESVNLKDTDLTTIEYSRTALRNYLGLNDKQMIILSTLGGNDIVGRLEVRQFHRRLGCTRENKFPLLAKYIKGLPMKFYPLLYTIASEVLRNDLPQTTDRLNESFEQYNIKFDTDDYSSDPLLRYCLENKLKCCLKALVRFDMNKMIKEQHCEYVPNYNNALMDLSKKQYGVLFQHKQFDEVYEENCKPIYPDVTVPPLMELLNRAEHPEHDTLRLKLLKWMINDELLAPHDLALITQKYLLPILILVFMTTHGFITVSEADLILYTLRQVDLELVPTALEAPEIIDARAYRISLLFNKLVPHMAQSVIFSGLTHSIEPTVFDGVFFNAKYLEFEFSAIDHLDDLTAYRLYA
ncbi:uncharacterized protein LOC119069685 [Bradysia coprophila]|uniref:uncharacterized protein LOC119069685 n=1 Tax=Bradysia coprophila TaxID=38358 RepID=UPI00187DB0C7|nr:uncharacterized protein LOC119069685 [Bradysia coprophila]